MYENIKPVPLNKKHLGCRLIVCDVLTPSGKDGRPDKPVIMHNNHHEVLVLEMTEDGALAKLLIRNTHMWVPVDMYHVAHVLSETSLMDDLSISLTAAQKENEQLKLEQTQNDLNLKQIDANLNKAAGAVEDMRRQVELASNTITQQNLIIAGHEATNKQLKDRILTLEAENADLRKKASPAS